MPAQQIRCPEVKDKAKALLYSRINRFNVYDKIKIGSNELL